jgi:nitrite reductase/ring-hydroxylating ferredoxin subunit
VELLESEELNKEIPESVGAKLGIRFGNQAQFNSYKYCTELCKKIEGDGSNVFEESRVDGIKEDKPHRIDLSQLNSSITSDLVIVATQLPITDRSLHFAFLEPVRSLCIAVKIDKDDGRHIRNMFITEDSKRSLRTITGDDSILIVAGEGYTHGDETKTDRFYESLESWARQHFNVREVLCRWSAMDYFSCDHIPFIGYLHRGTDTIFTATGFSKWGLACGVAGSYLIRDLIEGRGNEFASMLDARRWDLMHQYKGLALENWHVSKHLIGDKIKHLLKPGDVGALENGRGGIVRIGGKVIGAYRDEQGQYHFVKPVCTHVGCDLVFNEGDRVWDCPCHGSQFDVDGSVIHGPACKDLEVYKDLQW